MMIMTRQTPTSITMALLLCLLLLTSTPPIAATTTTTTTTTPLTTTNYRLQSSAYSLTLETSFELKQQNCVTNFGTGAALLDMKFAKSDFTNVDDFNEALTGVFFKSTTAAFFVAYDGRDAPLENNGGNRYAVITRQNERTDVTPVDEFGNAKVVQYHGEAQILCAVPVKNYDPKKEYVPKEEADKNKWFSSNNPFTMMRVSILVLVVGIGVVVRQRYSSGLGGGIGIGMMASPTSFFEKAYYNVLDSTSSMTTHNPSRRHYHAPTDSDLGTGLTQGCELSYNPVVQGVV